MVTKLVLRPHSLSSTFLSPNHFFSKPSLPKFQILSLFSTTTTTTTTTNTQTQTQTLTLTQPIISQSLSYGPSLHKGTNPSQQQQHPFHQSSITVSNQLKQKEEEEEEAEEEEQESDIIDEGGFTRVFDIAAIRVPSKDCFALENRLRGHLLNWPRIRNIARVPGDEVDEEFVNLLGGKRTNSDEEEKEDDSLVSLNRRIHGKAEGDGELLSPVLYRDKLANTFNSRGFVKFRNLAKMSRPKKKNNRKEEDEEGFKGKRVIGKSGIALVEVVEDNEEGEDLSGLLGEDFKGRKWRGSTRLLLLDEQYASSGVEDLPEAIKVAVPTL